MVPDFTRITMDMLYALDSVVDLGDTTYKAQKVVDILNKLGYLKNTVSSMTPQVVSALRKLQADLGFAQTGQWTPALTNIVSLGSTGQNIIPAQGYNPNQFTNNQPLSSITNISSAPPVVLTNRFSEKQGVNFRSNAIPCYIVNLNTNTTITFGTEPDQIEDSKSTQYEDEQTIGRSSPFKGYQGSGPRSVSFTITIVADYCPDGLVTTCNRMKALCYPHKSSHIVGPKALFVLGSFFKVVGTPKDVNVIYKKPYRDGMYTLADVSFSLDEVEDQTRFASEVEQNG